MPLGECLVLIFYAIWSCLGEMDGEYLIVLGVGMMRSGAGCAVDSCAVHALLMVLESDILNYHDVLYNHVHNHHFFLLL